MHKNNTKCVICGKPYAVCPTCENARTYKPWRTFTDTLEHYKIYIILQNYNSKKIDKEEAKEQLEKCNISDYKTFRPHIVKTIDEIMAYKKKAKKIHVPTVDEDVENGTDDTDASTGEVGTDGN